MKKLATLAIIGAAVIGLGAAAHATVLDFGAEAEFNGERGLASGSVLGPTAYIGTAVTLITNEPDYYAYLDGPGGSDPTAGLGVCKNVNASLQCVPGSDDNITGASGGPESVRIVFNDGPFDVREISFLGEGHIDFNGNDFNTLLIETNLAGIARYTFADAVAAAAAGAFLGVDWIEFFFDDASFLADGTGRNADQFYIGLISDIPVPGALPLLLSGLAGLGFASRRRRRQA